MKNKNLIYCTLILLISVIYSCNNEDGYHSVMEKIEAEETPFHGNITSEELLAGKNLIQVTEGEHTFFIPTRKNQLRSYACTECHTKPVNQLSSNAMKRAHWDIKLNHANSETMDCKTCHNLDDMNNLNSLTGKSIDLNLSYKLCAQCHTTQFEDWKGGAHGKKVAGWAPPRASMNCVNCHNPHDPAFKSKLPVIFNTQKAIERNDGLDH